MVVGAQSMIKSGFWQLLGKLNSHKNERDPDIVRVGMGHHG